MAPSPLGVYPCGLERQTLRRKWALEKLGIQFSLAAHLRTVLMAVGLPLQGLARTYRM